MDSRARMKSDRVQLSQYDVEVDWENISYRRGIFTIFTNYHIIHVKKYFSEINRYQILANTYISCSYDKKRSGGMLYEILL